MLEALDALPRLGLLDAPTPVRDVPSIAKELGLEWLGIKLDDGIEALNGGGKVRKLDYLLARPPFKDAEGWVSSGAIGSGHLTALTAAATALGRHLEAYVFWEPLIAEVLENLRFIASGPTSVHDHASRVALALRNPEVLIARRHRGLPVIPPGGSTASGMIGFVRAGAELCDQIDRGELPEPDRIYVALGSGGTAVGLSLGIALCGRQIPVHGVAAVERAFAPMRRTQDLLREVRELLAGHGIGLHPLARQLRFPIKIDHRHVGRGYGIASEASEAACERLRQVHVGMEPLYSGKAMAGLFRDAGRGETKRPLFWLTPRRSGSLPYAEDWQSRLPKALQRRLEHPERQGHTRRQLLVGGAALAVGVGALVRTTGYPERPMWKGTTFSAAQAHVLTCAAEALIGPTPHELQLRAVAENIDRYVATLPAFNRAEIHGLIALVEHGSPMPGGGLRRLTSQPAAERLGYIEGLAEHGVLMEQAYRGLRDLVMLGFYQQPGTWVELGYAGPWVERGPRKPSPYDRYRAAKGAKPKAMVS